MSERIFISYKRVDKERVFKLKDLIEYETHEKCWIDLDGIESHEQFVNVIIRAINAADLVLFMYSKEHSQITDFENDWTIRELNFAQEKQKRIFFINLDNAPLNDWFTMMFPRKQQVDVSSEAAVKKLILDIKNWLISNAVGVIRETKPVEKDDVEEDDDYETAEVLMEAKDYHDAVCFYLESARRGNKVAQQKLCQFFYDRRVRISEDISDDIWQMIEQLAQKGESYVLFLLHCKYFNDSVNNELAFDYIKKAAQNKDLPLAILRLGVHYGWGIGTKQNHILAMRYYHKALELGCKEAYGYIGSEYEWGSDKTQKNLNKALDFFTRGSELFDRRSMALLAKLYFWQLQQIDDAKNMAGKMIEQGYFGGYILMGDFLAINPVEMCYNGEQDIEKAKEWYRKALLHDEYEAFASLASLYWYHDNNRKEAYSLVYQGYHYHDSQSISTLAGFCLAEEDFDKAWLYYKEAFDRTGSFSSQLGYLYLEKNYRKDSTEEEKRLETDLDSILSSGAQNGDSDSLKYLIRLHTLQQSGEDKYEYDVFKAIPQVQEDIKLGAELNNPEMMFYYGRLLLDDSFREFNPVKGISFVVNAAADGYNDALPFLLDYHKSGAYKDSIDYARVATIAIKQKYIEEESLHQILRHGESDESLSEEFKEYLLYVLDQKKERTKVFVVALNILLNKYKKGELTLDEKTLSECKIRIEEELQKNNFGYVSVIKSNLNILFNDYNEEKTFCAFLESNEIERKLFYSASFANEHENDLDMQDGFLDRLHSLIQFDESVWDDTGCFDKDVMELLQAIDTFWTAYQSYCDKEGVTQKKCFVLKNTLQFPYIPSSVCSRVSQDFFSIFLGLYDSAPSLISPILPILREEDRLSKILDYAETLSDQDFQLLLISLVEINIDVENVILNNLGLYQNYKDNNKKAIIDYLNRLKEKLGDRVKSKDIIYTEENLPDILSIPLTHKIPFEDIYSYVDYPVSQSDVDNHEEDYDPNEFERLLNSFLASESSDFTEPKR